MSYLTRYLTRYLTLARTRRPPWHRGRGCDFVDDKTGVSPRGRRSSSFMIQNLEVSIIKEGYRDHTTVPLSSVTVPSTVNSFVSLSAVQSRGSNTRRVHS